MQHCELNRSGAQPSNHAAAQDVHWTINQVSNEVSTLKFIIHTNADGSFSLA
jgi:hypothetical protein